MPYVDFDLQMSQDFTSDYTGNDGFNSGAITQENGSAKNGGGDGTGKDSGAAESPGRDDERLEWEKTNHFVHT